MKIDELNNNHITAEEGKVFRRISDSQLFGNEIYLGYTYYLSGEKLEEPLLELRGVLINLHLVRDALRDAEAAEEWVKRIELLHHEHIVHRHVHCQARGG